MKTWEDIPIIQRVKRESQIRFEIVSILEEYPEGLLVTQIREKLKGVGFNVSQPAVSKHLATLGKSHCLISEVKRRDERLKRKVTYYRSLASLYSLISDMIMERASLAFADALEEIEHKLPKFENVFSLQSFLTYMAGIVGGQIGVSNNLYSQLSARKPYGELAKLLWEFQDVVSHIDVALQDKKSLERAKGLFTPSELQTLKDRYNIAMNLILRSLEGDERFMQLLKGLLQEAEEPIKRYSAEVTEFLNKHKGDSRLL